MRSTLRPLLVSSLVAASVLAAAPGALAQEVRPLMSPTGGRGQLNIDQLGAYRIGTFSGLSYSGILGFAVQKFSYDTQPGTVTDHYTTFWIAPAADYFVLDHFSIGGFLEVSSTSGSRDRPINPTQNVNDKIPAATNFTLLPRIGWMFPLGDRIGIWPRGGIGWASRQTPVSGSVGTNNPEVETYSSVILDLEVPVLFRFNETFYLSGTPQFLTSLGGSNSTFDNANREISSSGSFLQFAVTIGFGVLLDL